MGITPHRRVIHKFSAETGSDKCSQFVLDVKPDSGLYVVYFAYGGEFSGTRGAL